MQGFSKPHAYLWVYDPETDKVYLEDEKGDHPAHFPTHQTIAEHVTHPDRAEGFAQPIEGGWRVTDETGTKAPDKFIVKRIQLALRHKHPLQLPHLRQPQRLRHFNKFHTTLRDHENAKAHS